MGFRKSAVAAGSGLLLMSIVGTALMAAPAGAKTPIGTGTFTCTNVTGSVTYTPAWSNTGKGSVKASFSLTGTNCSGGTPTPTTVTITGKGKFPNGSGNCPVTSANWAGKFKATFAPLAKKSKVTGAFASVGSNPGHLGFLNTNALIVPVVVTGSYATSGSAPDLSALGTSTGNCTTGVSSTTFTSGLLSNI